ncbi:MAG TPA: DUF397 domain-containing protein [Actinokineospora sp.]|jgi:hypothetical protein|nr:DUF397 domain-containing protein [Actinokineospora sp.]
MRYEDAAAALAAAGNWHKSSFSEAQNGCVEVGSAAAIVGVRDTKLALASPILGFPTGSWATFVAITTRA